MPKKLPKPDITVLIANKDGSYTLRSKKQVRAAIEAIALQDEQIEQARQAARLEAMEERRGALKSAVDAFVLDHESYEDEDIRITRVQSFRREWNADKLEKMLPRGVFKNVVKIAVVPAKIDQYVRQGKIDRDAIEAAFEETPNAPYAKWTDKADPDRATKDAEGLAEALGV